MTNDEVIELANNAGVLFTSYGDSVERLVQFAELVAAKERAACAQRAKEIYGDDMAKSIRARGKK